MTNPMTWMNQMKLPVTTPSATSRHRFNFSGGRIAIWFLLLTLTSLCAPIASTDLVFATEIGQAGDQQNDEVDEGAEVKKIRTGRVVSIPLPMTGSAAEAIEKQLQQLADDAPPAVRPEDRPLIILEFDTENGQSGSGSDLGSCFSLSRFLLSPSMRRLETVAYIPARRGETILEGHAVLIAISASDLAMDQQASIGNAGIDERNITLYVRQIYEGLVAERLVVPVPIAVAMLDPSEKLSRVDSDNKIIYVNQVELDKLEAAGKADKQETLAGEQEMLKLTSKELLDFRLIRNRTESRADLARRYGIEPSSLTTASDATERIAVASTMPPFIDATTVGWFNRSFNAEVNFGKTNMIVIELADCNGDASACLRLAEYLAGIDGEKVLTVAYVNGKVEGPAGLIALACDQTIFSPAGTIGSYADPTALDPAIAEGYEKAVRAIGEMKDKDWSIMMAMLDPNLKIKRYQNRDRQLVRFLSQAEYNSLPDVDTWLDLGVIDVSRGIDLQTAKELFPNREPANDMTQLLGRFRLKTKPKKLEPSATDKWIEKLAAFFASPAISTFLLFGSVFFLMNEASAPGTGIMGFFGALCLLAFFWSQYLDGNVQGFEILLLVGGVIFVLLEIFLLPGFGIFGIGGLLMIVASIVLASQSFIIPLTSKELEQAPYSLLPIIGAGLGFVAGVYTLRKVLPNMPYFRNMMLAPQKRDETGLDGDHDPEAIVDWSYLEGRKGVAVTRLMPSGKAKIDGRVYDVMTDGRVVNKGEPIVVTEATGNRVIVGSRDTSIDA